MNNKALITMLLAALSLAACGPKKNDQTLKSLEDKAVNIVIEKDVVVDHAREKAMEIYQDFDKKNTDPALRLEAQRRLADLEIEKSEEKFLKELDKLDRGNETTIDPENVKLQSYRKAITLYEDLLERAGPTGGNPQTIYQLAKAYESIGNRPKSLALLDRLSRDFPDVPFIGEVQFRRGELAFQLRDFNKSAISYAAVMSLGEFTVFYEKALYKHGWSLFKQSRYDEALNSFFQLLDRKLIESDTLIEGVQLVDETGQIKVGQTKLSGGDRELVDDTLRVVNLSLGYLDGAHTVRAYFEKNGRRNYEDQVYESLGDFYLKQERIRDAAETYLLFSKINQQHYRAPLFHIKTIDAYRKGGFAKDLFNSKKDFVETYAFKKDGVWERRIDTRTVVVQQLKKNMEEIARHYHAKAQKSKTRSKYNEAITWYEAFIKTFPKDSKTSSMNFLLAEALYENKQYEDAVKEYEKTAYQYRRFDKGAEAAYAALLAYSQQEKKLQGKKKVAWRRMSIASSMRFGKVYPADPRAPKVLIKVAEDLFSLKRYDPASKAARQVLELKSNVPLENRVSAWRIIAHTAFDKDNYKEAESSYKIALELVSSRDPIRQELVDGMAASVYKQAELLKQKGNNREAIIQFSRIADIAPNSPIVVTAAYDVATSHLEAKNWQAAVASLKNFRNKYPNHELASSTTQNLVNAYMNLGKPMEAARELDVLAQYKDDPETKRQIDLKIIDLYEKANATDKIRTAYKKYIALYPAQFDDTMEMRQKLADMYAAQNQTSKQHYWLKQIVAKDKKAASQRTDRSQFLAAKASYILAMPVVKEFEKVKLVEPLQANMKKKKKVMEKALKVLQGAAEYGIAEVATASTYHMANIYSQFASELMSSERPGGLSPEELEQYDILLEDQVYPFEEKSIEIHESNSGRVAEGVYDVWVRKSFAALNTLLPVRYAKVERGEAYIDVVR